MKKLSLQWRIALLTALFIAISCIALNFLIYHSGAHYFGVLHKYVTEKDGEYPFPESTDDTGKKVIIDVPPEEFNAFYDDFTRELADAEFEFRIMSWVITLLVSAIFGTISFFVTGKLLSPLKEFSEQAEHIEAENITEIKFEENTIPEFQQLSRTINRMLLRLNDAFTTQKQFSSNAAHELRTPLALMQAKLDLYIEEHTGEDPDSMETILLLSEQTDKLSHLVRTLLDMSDFEDIPRNDHVDLKPLAEEVPTDLLPCRRETDRVAPGCGKCDHSRKRCPAVPAAFQSRRKCDQVQPPRWLRSHFSLQRGRYSSAQSGRHWTWDP